jgi:hypothetical protein
VIELSASAKFGFFILAVLSMAALAGASIMMAQGQGWLATVLFLVAFVLIFFGIRTRRKLMKKLS